MLFHTPFGILPHMQKLEGVLSNLEGTLINNRPLIIAAFRHTFDAHGMAQPRRGEILDTIGLPLSSSFQLLTKTSSFPNTDRLVATYLRFKRNNPQLAMWYPDAERSLDWMQEKGIPVSLVVTQSTVMTRNMIDHFGLARMFHTVITRDDVQDQKPHPEGLLRALRSMDIPARHAIMFGHAASDIEAGYAARCRASIAIAHDGVDTKLLRAKPTTIIHDNWKLVSEVKKILK